MSKPLSPRQISKQETKLRRDSMIIKVISFNIQQNKLSSTKKEYFKLLSLESKLYYNYLIKLSESITDDYGFYYSNSLFDFNTKPNTIEITWYNEPQYYELQVLTAQMKQISNIVGKTTSYINRLIRNNKPLE